MNFRIMQLIFSAQTVISDVKKAKEISDMTIAFLHTGAEYSTEPDTEEKTFLQLLLHQGVDIAICAHSPYCYRILRH